MSKKSWPSLGALLCAKGRNRTPYKYPSSASKTLPCPALKHEKRKKRPIQEGRPTQHVTYGFLINVNPHARIPSASLPAPFHPPPRFHASNSSRGSAFSSGIRSYISLGIVIGRPSSPYARLYLLFGILPFSRSFVTNHPRVRALFPFET